MSIPHSPGDKVTVIHGDSPDDPVIGKTGTVRSVNEDENFVFVRGLEPRAKELILGERAFTPSQLQAAN